MSTASTSAVDNEDEPPVKVMKESNHNQSSPILPSDFVIMCEEKEFPVHKRILSKHSDYFKILLEGATCMVEVQTNTIDLMDMDSAIVKLVIDYMYGNFDASKIDYDNLRFFLDVSSHLQIQSLIEKLSNWMCDNFTAAKFRLIADLAELYSLNKVTSRCLNRIAKQFEFYCDNDVLMKDIAVDEMCEMLSLDSLQVSSEYELMNWVINWIEHLDLGLEEKDSIRERCLLQIRFVLMESSELHVLQTKPQPKPVTKRIQLAISYHDHCDQSLNTNLMPSSQYHVRCAEPTLVLVVKNNVSKCEELVACTRCPLTTQTHTYTLNSTNELSDKICGLEAVGNHLFFVTANYDGGFDTVDATLTKVQYYDPITRRSHRLPNPTRQYVPSGVSVLNNKLYVCGGSIRSNTIFVPYCQAIDLKDHTWSEITNLPFPLNNCAMASQAGLLYVSGGQRQATNRFISITDALLAYDPDAPTPRNWVCKANMRVGRRGHSMVAVKDRYLIVCGGLPFTMRRCKTIPLELYDVTTDQWSEIEGAQTILGPSAGHFVILPHLPKTVHSLGHELPDALETEIWCSELDDFDMKVAVKSNKKTYVLPTHYQLTHAFASYLYVNLNDNYVKACRNQHNRRSNTP